MWDLFLEDDLFKIDKQIFLLFTPSEKESDGA